MILYKEGNNNRSSKVIIGLRERNHAKNFRSGSKLQEKNEGTSNTVSSIEKR